MRICLTVISLLFIVGCADTFPATDLYRINHVDKICEIYKINPDNVSFKFERDIPFDNCPQNIFGFKEEDAGKVSAWARRMKKKYKK